ncbi:TniQ family protein [Mycobacterium sp. DL440]|uniref:TniQ family protein n=1 Tax=Mycobacterium sp. DL440 TaxID=2675523 RepID=UPI00142079F3|nr:TniQ family protein [Mycobacterium sp. DL440]
MTVAPFDGEIGSSYLQRLANANYFPLSTLRTLVGITPQARQIDPVRLASVSGYDQQTLQTRLRLLDGQSYYANVVASCRLCMARRKVLEPVYCMPRLYRVVCLRHHLWIGLPVREPRDQVSVSSQPAVIGAARTHRKLQRRYLEAEIEFLRRDAVRIMQCWQRIDTGSIATTTTEFSTSCIEAAFVDYVEQIHLTATLIRHLPGRNQEGSPATALQRLIGDMARRYHISPDSPHMDILLGWHEQQVAMCRASTASTSGTRMNNMPR